MAAKSNSQLVVLFIVVSGVTCIAVLATQRPFVDPPAKNLVADSGNSIAPPLTAKENSAISVKPTPAVAENTDTTIVPRTAASVVDQIGSDSPSNVSEEPTAVLSLSQFFQRMEQLKSRANREGYTQRVATECLQLLREGKRLRAGFEGTDSYDSRIRVTLECLVVSQIAELKEPAAAQVRTVKCTAIRTKLVGGRSYGGDTFFSIVATVQNFGPAGRFRVVLEALDETGSILKVADVEGTVPASYQQQLASQESMNSNIFRRISRWQVATIRFSTDHSNWEVSDVQARVIIPESDPDERNLYEVSATFKNNGPKEIRSPVLHAIDAEGFIMEDVLFDGTVPAGATRTFSVRGGMISGDYSQIRNWVPSLSR